MIAAAIVCSIMLGEKDIKIYQDTLGSMNLILWCVFLVVGLLPLLITILRIITTHLAITNKRVLGKHGILKVNTMDMHIDKMENVSYKAGFWGNIFHYYTVTIKGVSGDGWEYKGISNAREFKNMTNNAIECHAQEARREQAELIVLAMNANKS